MHKQEFLKEFIEAISNYNDVEKVKVTYKNGKTMEIGFDYEDDNDENDELEDETVVEVDKDDCADDGYDDDDDDDDDDNSKY